MAYASWSVVAGEQPTAAKWNILGTNDASFNDGSGIGTSAITPEKLLSGAGTSWSWQTYTPSWSSSGTQPAIGNGTLTGSYVKIGKVVIFEMYFKAGSTTTFGTGNFYWTFPVAEDSMYQTATVNRSFHGGGYFERNSIQGYGSAHGFTNGTVGSGKFSIGYTGTNGQASIISQTAPFTWSNGDYINFSGYYKAA